MLNKKNSIYAKIRRQTLLISIISVLFVCAVAYIGVSYMRDGIMEAGELLGVSAAEDSMVALELQMEESLLRLAKNKAAVSNEKLDVVASQVRMLAETATVIMSNPGNYVGRSVLFPDAANEGVIVAQLRLPEGVSPESVREETQLIGNLSDQLIAIHKNSESVNSAYIGSERGVSISVDADSNQKTNIYDPRTRPWYMTAKAADSLIWTEVFSDNSGRGLAITCAMPYYDATGEISGVAGIGMLLENLKDVVVGTKIGETGYAFILNEKGDMIIADSQVIKDNLLEIDDYLPHETVRNMIAGASGLERVTIQGADFFVAYEPLATLPWSLAIVMSVEEVIAPAVTSESHIIALKNNALADIGTIIVIISLAFGAILILTIGLNIVLTKKLAGNLANPIIELNKGAGIIGGGDLSYRLNVKTGDEIESLADTFNAMIDNIQQITAEKERIGAELNVATNIQASMLPCLFPAFPSRQEFDIYATMLPAKEVGGDFYDFFLIDEDHLAVVMADVSGKGVPAALFMVIAKTLIKNNACAGNEPQKVFATVNNMLCENNESGMFVTAFMGYLNVQSGVFRYVNAGHNPPLLKKAGGSYEFLPVKAGFILGALEDISYKEDEITLAPGDTLYLYTDGVTEALNGNNELFSNPRLLEAADKYSKHPLQTLLVGIKAEIDAFADGAEQADDITMLALTMHESAKEAAAEMKELTIAATTENLAAVLDFVNAELERSACPQKLQTQIDISVEEIFVNIAHYAYSPGKGDVTIRMSTGAEVVLEFADRGRPYNPLDNSDPDINKPLAEREIGGLGIFMVKKFMDTVAYRTDDGKNILTFRKKIIR
jgi:sigma-B regulation protein RsbU (phosphoserine phosphatase)